MKITLGIDPGFDRMGYGVISTEGACDQLVAYGCLTTQKSTPFGTRLADLSCQLDALLSEHRPQAAGIEKLYFSKNVKTALDVGHARGVILLSLAKHGIPLVEITPGQVKMAVCGWGRADKRQVQQMVKTLLALPTIPRPDDAADALAIALCASRHTTGA